jgi:pyruvate,orthophosphate dikinase
MLNDPARTHAEVGNILEQVQRNYQHVVHRVITPFEKMKERLGFDDEELRIALANMQRYMHDLNSIASFLDIARARLVNDPADAERPLGSAAPGPVVERKAARILHLSHLDEIDRLVENDESACSLRDWYGSKGSGLVYISYLRLPTRDGFIVPTIFARDGRYADESVLDRDLDEHLEVLENDISRRNGTGKVFGDPARPLLLAVRGGSVFSMPGMLATVLFVGMNDEIAEGLAREDPWCAYDSYRRFLASYGAAVWGVDMEDHDLVDDAKRKYGVDYKTQIPWQGMKEIAERTKELLHEQGYGEALEQALASPRSQLAVAVRAVFASWNSEGTRRFRDIKTISDSWKTAVTVQEMALGNFRTDMNGIGVEESEASLTGVIPRTRVNELGIRVPTGDFKFSAPGEDLVGGLTRAVSFRPMPDLAKDAPMLDRRLSHCAATLRRFMGTDQEIEFTVERGVLSFLQSRAAEIGANRTPTAFEDDGGETARGIGVRGGAFRGIVVFDEAELRELSSVDLSHRDDVDGVLVVVENPSPEEIPLMLLADAVLAARGGSTSHVAIAVNGIEGREYHGVVGVDALRVNAGEHEAHFVDREGNTFARVTSGDVVSIHGRLGSVYVGSRRLKSV